MSEHLGLYIAIVALANICAALWLIWWTARGSGALPPQQTTHVWDGDLTEYNNPLPRWWLGLFLLCILFGFCYLALYPGLGNYPGLLHWSSAGALRADQQAAQSDFERSFGAVRGESLAQLGQDPALMNTGRNLYALNCSPCHGSDARGAKGFPNLTDNDWLWGGSDEMVLQTISYGRNGVMPAWLPILGAAGVDQVTAYVLSLSGRHPADTAVEAGKATFATLCSACHGADAKGNPLLGAPNLTDDIWLHGGAEQDIHDSIANGRNNHMPAQLERLGETRVRLLAAYVLSLSRPAGPAQAAPP